ncbi:MAG: LptF/LptG family permease [Candidatus Omnitrophica bacterium]|nr:LptF/LptG family permease [Candidatus Omnitrophota bacterium]
MRTIDRYIIRQLSVPIVFCSATLVLLVLFADVFDRLNEFLKNQAAISDVLRYYLALSPYSFVQTIPWATFLGTVYLLSTFNHHNELLAMKTAGMRITTIAGPMLFTGLVIGVITFIINDRVVPPTSLIAEQIRDEKIEANVEHAKEKMLTDITYFGRNNLLYYIKKLNPENSSLEGLIILTLDKDRHVRQKTIAHTAVMENGAWTLKNASAYGIDRKGRLIGEPKLLLSLPMPEMTETFKDFEKASKEGEFLSYKELKYYLDHLEKSGLTVKTQKVDLQHKLSFPWNSMIMMLICIPFLSRTLTRRGLALTILQCLCIVFGYHTLGAIALALGKSGSIPPFISAWIASFLFAVVGIFYMERANY